MNFIKKLFMKKKENEAKKFVSDYGDFSIECLYHDHFIKIINNIILMTQSRKDPIQSPEVYSSESKVMTTSKNENLNLNFSNNIFKESVLCSINEFIKSEDEILEFSNIILKIYVKSGTDSTLDLFSIMSPLFHNIQKAYTYNNTINPGFTIIMAASCKELLELETLLISCNLISDNKLSLKLINCINSIIPVYETKNGNEYFTGLDDTVIDIIKPYRDSQFQIQVLSHNNAILDNKYMSSMFKNQICVLSKIYLIIDNPLVLESAICSYTYYKIPDINRYIVRINYSEISDFLMDLDVCTSGTAEVNISNYDNIISKITEIIPREVLEYSAKNSKYNSEYDDVDEIIE